ncbi:DUF1801 domain-containing protein [Listeria booriae]|uniref:DUF1801 domain-containing protein n=1 Tax=Listeria booriae TaxID=1552123 RepID=UPI0016270341|nr:DUF1801 domain-containing protein [Listeria booriae]MBC1290284.1 DUF1801 domain-containing protein [Listeria booriae]MBC1334285.1 DUF1801 domain-containing protein [Listeria booriae]MBC1649015.1 DUF1801 domain-containing protein [Listeria booriae]MBC1918201.1 DUF1801 domain-containing protein [Listeria booriae]MBC1944352.1 DUF1801 domain-containing protein [Listeria booriae]
MTIEEYMEDIAPEQKEAFARLMQVVDENIPAGFTKEIQYGMPSYVVPKTRYPDGYHCDTSLSLPFFAIAAQKRHIAVYHMGLSANEPLLSWFQAEYPNHMTTKLNMGKGCIRFTNPKKIPYELIGELASKVTVDEWIHQYETAIKN